jgi:lysine 2,3-aminomutase
MTGEQNFLHKPRHYSEIELFQSITDKQWNSSLWQLKHSIREVDELAKIIRLTDNQLKGIKDTIAGMRKQGKEPLRITPYYASLMQENPFFPEMLEGERQEERLDPIFWQSVPTPAHLLFPKAAVEEAMSEGSRSYGSVYQRYPNRVAFFVGSNTNCAAYCTHCQRAKSLDKDATVTTEDIKKGLFYISINKNIDEVLITGGDALQISKKLLASILSELSKINHLRVIRIATRVPVVMPMGITDELLDIIKTNANKHTVGIPKYVYFMTHLNHYQEITEDFARCIKKIQDWGFTIRNQTVMLKHVNAYYKTLAETFRRMFWVGLHPYYLLQCHKERGIVHFITPIQIGKIYMKHLQGWISGVVKPSYAVNVEGGGGKVMLMPSGHDTLNIGGDLEAKRGKPHARVRTWDGRIISDYEALGRCTQQEYDDAISLMDKFIERKGVFLPSMIIVDNNNKPVSVTNVRFPELSLNEKKSALLDYELQDNEMPWTNPWEISDFLDKEYIKQKEKIQLNL